MYSGTLTVFFSFPELVCEFPTSFEYCTRFQFSGLPEDVELLNTDVNGSKTYFPYDFTTKCEEVTGVNDLASMAFDSAIRASTQLLPYVGVQAYYLPCPSEDEDEEMPPP